MLKTKKAIRQPVARPVPEFRIEGYLGSMQKDLGERIGRDLAKWRVDIRKVEKPKFKSKIGAVGKYLWENRFYKHPLRLLRAVGTAGKDSLWNAVFSSKKAGARNYLKERREYAIVTGLREKHQLQSRLDNAYQKFGTRMNTIFRKLQSDVRNGRATKTNWTRYLERYEKDLKRAENMFEGERERILKGHEVEFIKAGKKVGLPRNLRKP